MKIIGRRDVRFGPLAAPSSFPGVMSALKRMADIEIPGYPFLQVHLRPGDFGSVCFTTHSSICASSRPRVPENPQRDFVHRVRRLSLIRRRALPRDQDPKSLELRVTLHQSILLTLRVALV